MKNMTSGTIYSIRETPHNKEERNCPLCVSRFRPGHMAVHNDHDIPICELCAWENAATLASLLHLNESATYPLRGNPPAWVEEALEKRKNDPEQHIDALESNRLWLESYYGSNHTMLGAMLADLLNQQTDAALHSGDVETMKQARLLFIECYDKINDSIIPARPGFTLDSSDVETMKQARRIFDECADKIAANVIPL